jgi:hypothetical protein
VRARSKGLQILMLPTSGLKASETRRIGNFVDYLAITNDRFGLPSLTFREKLANARSLSLPSEEF